MSFTIIPASPIDGDAILPIAAAMAHLRVEDVTEEPMIEALTIAAIDWVERHCSLSLAPRAFVYHGSGFPKSNLKLPMGPVSAVDSVAYLDVEGASQDLASPGAWRLAGDELALAARKCWPVALAGAGSVTVSFTAGFTSAAAEAPALISAVKLLLGSLYMFREDAIAGVSISEIPLGVTRLCQYYRMPVL